MRALADLLADPRIVVRHRAQDGIAGWIERPSRRRLAFVASWGGGWDQVSVSSSPGSAIPTWDEMDYAAAIFFRDDETPVQFHVRGPAKVDIHPNCLHLWRPQDASVPMPQREFV